MTKYNWYKYFPNFFTVLQLASHWFWCVHWERIFARLVERKFQTLLYVLTLVSPYGAINEWYFIENWVQSLKSRAHDKKPRALNQSQRFGIFRLMLHIRHYERDGTLVMYLILYFEVYISSLLGESCYLLRSLFGFSSAQAYDEAQSFNFMEGRRRDEKYLWCLINIKACNTPLKV